MLAGCANLENRDVDLHLQKFNLQPPTITLAKKFEALGMKTAFDKPKGSANFDKIAPRTPTDYLYISQIFHKTFIAVDEKGTEAAAARSEEHTSELQSQSNVVCRLLLEKKLTTAEHVGVGREHQRFVTRRRSALHDVTRDGTVLQYIQLHPQPSAGTAGHVLPPGRRHGAQGERHAKPRGGARERQVALGVQHAVQAGRGDGQGRVGGAPENRRAPMARAGVDE